MSDQKIPVKQRIVFVAEFSTETHVVTVKMLNACIKKHKLPIDPYTSLYPKDQKILYELWGYPPSVDRSLYENV